MSKLFQKKTENPSEQSGKGQKTAPGKKPPPKSVKPKKAEGPKKVARKSEESRMDWVQAFRQYLREVVYELRKVIWPSRKETTGSTLVVLVIVMLCGVFLGIVDGILSRLVRLLVG